MSDTVGSALLRRYIGRRLVALRLHAGLTQEVAAQRLQRARATLGRMEEGHEGVRFRDYEVRAILDLYGASEKDVQLLLALTAETRNGRRKSWWHDYTETALPEWFGLYVSLEDSAEAIRQYEPELVPGLLQTRAYAEQVTRVPAGHIPEDESERRVRVRMERQSLLHRHRPPAPQLSVILNESVLHRIAGNEKIMADQFTHLLDLTGQATVSIRILPFAAGLHGGMASAFTLLDFPRDPHTSELLEPPLVYVDTLTGAMYLHKPDEVAAYELAWRDLVDRTLDEESSRRMINSALKGLHND
ncbi:helix-turn-helix transcriptional regulator [Micromonospora sp. WMMA1363]|uniref:helix-turn-helix domain-containing protein n=1 Tax=Micromonospora sp. WMMA1363 TaxID=3053985 RepID=UPI00259CBC52|nr:helix-turn-helix transcriptional regulator [Micromonospora sp. WMMA1363]MDM4723174.1 helix-turn-helix transcriptional regulator [Micromonospora sp. WMMA1363]